MRQLHQIDVFPSQIDKKWIGEPSFSIKFCRFFYKLSYILCICFVFCFFSCADKIPQKKGFKELQLYSYDKKSTSLSLSSEDPDLYLFYYLKDKDYESGVFSSSDIVPSSLEISFSPTQEDTEVFVAFLFASDFDESKLNNVLPARPVAQSTLPAGKKTSVSLALPADGSKAKGFFIKSTGTVTIDDVSVVRSTVGWRYSENEVSWSFGPEGGKSSALRNLSDSGSMSVDLGSARALGTDRRAVASLGTGSSAGIMLREYVKVYFRNDKSDAGENGNQGTMSIVSGKMSFRIRRSPEPQTETFFVPYFFETNQERVISIVSGAEMVSGVEHVFVPSEVAFSEKGERIPYAITADLGCVPSWPSSLWQRKDFELFRWNMFPNILVFDFADYDVQDDYLKRLAFYVEKAGYRGKLWEDSDIANLHGYNAHDYRAESLAQFYETARTQGFKLNDSEYFLRDILLQYGIIICDQDGGFVAGDGGIISISKQSDTSQREKLLVHESFHGIYFGDELFRDKVTEVCNVMDQHSLQFITQYFASQPTLNYDLNDTYLIENEVMAYIMQQSVSTQKSYFADNLAWRSSVINYMPDLATYVRNTKASGITEAAVLLDNYAFERWGLNAGRTAMISVSR